MDPKFRQTAGDAGYGMAPVGNAAEAGRDFSMIRPGKAADVEPLRQIYNHAVEHSTATFVPCPNILNDCATIPDG